MTFAAAPRDERRRRRGGAGPPHHEGSRITGTTPPRVEDTRGYAQGEIFLLTDAGDHMDALVYNKSAMAYRPMRIRRVSTYEFRRGRPVHLLRSPEAVTWVMQTFTDHVDPALTEADLPGLGGRLALPEGWRFSSVTLDRDLAITTCGVAGVDDFDPWSAPS